MIPNDRLPLCLPAGYCLLLRSAVPAFCRTPPRVYAMHYITYYDTHAPALPFIHFLTVRLPVAYTPRAFSPVFCSTYVVPFVYSPLLHEHLFATRFFHTLPLHVVYTRFPCNTRCVALPTIIWRIVWFDGRWARFAWQDGHRLRGVTGTRRWTGGKKKGRAGQGRRLPERYVPRHEPHSCLCRLLRLRWIAVATPARSLVLDVFGWMDL